MTDSIDQLSANALSSLDALKELQKIKHSQADNNGMFEKVLNQILVKELMTPMLNSSLFGAKNNYGYFLQDAMTNYLAQNLNIIYPNISGREVK